MAQLTERQLLAIQDDRVQISHGRIVASHPVAQTSQFLVPAKVIIAMQDIEHYLLPSDGHFVPNRVALLLARHRGNIQPVYMGCSGDSLLEAVTQRLGDQSRQCSRSQSQWQSLEP
jgi:hypothetical protein